MQPSGGKSNNFSFNHHNPHAEYPESIEDSVSKSALYLTVWREEYSARERNGQRYITFTSKAVLQGLCSEAVLQGVLEKGLSMLLGIRKTGKCWTKVIFLQNMELKLKHQNPFHKK